MVELQSGLEEWEKNSTLVVDVEAEEHSYLREQGERRREVEQHQRSHWFPVVLMKDVHVYVCVCACALVHSGEGEVVGELCEINWV